jgi:hypothetical protein
LRNWVRSSGTDCALGYADAAPDLPQPAANA